MMPLSEGRRSKQRLTDLSQTRARSHLVVDVATDYLDGRKSYNHINLAKLAGDSAVIGYSPMVLRTRLHLYAAVRVVRVQGASASGVLACTGVLPG